MLHEIKLKRLPGTFYYRSDCFWMFLNNITKRSYETYAYHSSTHTWTRDVQMPHRRVLQLNPPWSPTVIFPFFVLIIYPLFNNVAAFISLFAKYYIKLCDKNTGLVILVKVLLWNYSDVLRTTLDKKYQWTKNYISAENQWRRIVNYYNVTRVK